MGVNAAVNLWQQVFEWARFPNPIQSEALHSAATVQRHAKPSTGDSASYQHASATALCGKQRCPRKIKSAKRIRISE